MLERRDLEKHYFSVARQNDLYTATCDLQRKPASCVLSSPILNILIDLLRSQHLKAFQLENGDILLIWRLSQNATYSSTKSAHILIQELLQIYPLAHGFGWHRHRSLAFIFTEGPKIGHKLTFLLGDSSTVYTWLRDYSEVDDLVSRYQAQDILLQLASNGD